MMKLLALSDQQLMAFIKAGGKREDRALRQLLKEHGPTIKQFVVQHGGSLEAGEEVLYDALTSMVFNIRHHKFEGQSQLGTYLFAIAKRKWYQVMNKEVKLEQRHKAFGHTLDHHETYEDRRLDHADQQNVLGGVLDLLGKGCREVLLLWGAHYNMEEIAQKMSFKNAQIAMNKKSKCFQQLLKKLDHNPALKQQLANLHFG